MAKSLRSKWRRKCRAVKRERYGKKELERLKKTLGIDDSQSGSQQDVKMEEVASIANVKSAQEIIKERKETNESEIEEMDVGNKRVFNSRTLRDQHGTYPVWVHPRKIMKKAKKGRKTKTNKKSKEVNKSNKKN